MPTLHVRSVPEDLYQRLQEMAVEENRSLSAQVVTLLYEALEQETRRRRQAAALRSIRRRRFVPPPEMSDSAEMLRKDRDR